MEPREKGRPLVCGRTPVVHSTSYGVHACDRFTKSMNEGVVCDITKHTHQKSSAVETSYGPTPLQARSCLSGGVSIFGTKQIGLTSLLYTVGKMRKMSSITCCFLLLPLLLFFLVRILSLLVLRAHAYVRRQVAGATAANFGRLSPLLLSRHPKTENCSDLRARARDILQ